jgi:MFS family permease
VDKPASATANLLIVVGVFTLLAALGSGFLADKVGRKQLLVVAGLLATAGTVLLIASPSMIMVYVSGSILGLSAGLFMTTSWALGADLAPKAEAARYLGISNLAGAGAGIVGAGIGGPLADFFNGYSQGAGYLVVFAIYAACFLLSIVTLIAIKPPQAREAVI